MPISGCTGSLRVVRFLKPSTLRSSSQVGRRFTSPCVLRSIRDGALPGVVFPTVRVTYRLWCLSSASSGPRAVSRAFVRNRPRPTRAPSLVKGQGLLGRGHLRSGGSRPLERPRVPSSATVLHSRAVRLAARRTRSRHEVASRGDASLVFATDRPCCRSICLLAPLFARIAWMRGSISKDGKSPSMVAGSSAIDVLRLRRLPLRMHAHRPESPVSRGVALQR